MIDSPWVAALITLFLWWFSTGIILWRVRVADNGTAQDHKISVIVGLPLLAVGLLAARASLMDLSTEGIYLAFLAALALWGWIELAFLSGVITGPNTHPCPPFASQKDRFWRAVGTIAWHEALLVATLAGLGLATIDAANPFAFGTFALLFVARISAKLNLFLGVPRINVHFFAQAAVPFGQPLSHWAHDSAFSGFCFVPDRIFRPAFGTGDQRRTPGYVCGLCAPHLPMPAGLARALVYGAATARRKAVALDDARRKTAKRPWGR